MTLEQRDREKREEGFKEGFKEGFEESFKKGFEEGLEEGEAEMAALYKYLIKENRLEDLERASVDANYRKELFRELNLD